MTTTTAPEAIRTLFGSSGRRRLTCSRCKEFSTTNQASYSAHLRDCSGGSTIPTAASALPLLAGASAAVANLSLWPSGVDDDQSGSNFLAAALKASGNPPGAHTTNAASWIVDPLSWQLVYQTAAKQLPSIAANAANSTQHSLLTLASAAMAADNATANAFSSGNNNNSLSPVHQVQSAPNVATTTASSGTNNGQPPALSLIGEETGERYGFREVFKHMYQAMVNGTMAYCCRLCPYQHAVRSRVTKHIRLQHFSKQALNMFTCELCSFTTQHATELEHHRRRHAVNTKVYKCSECEYSTPMQNNFKRHLRRHTSADAFVCSFCSFSSPHEATVKRHAFLYHRKSTDSQGTTTPGNNPSAMDASKMFSEAINEEEDFVGVEFDEDEDDNHSNSSLKPAVAKTTKAQVKSASKAKKQQNQASHHLQQQQQQMDIDSADKSSESGASSHGSNIGVFVCDVCSMGFQSLRSFSQHRSEHERVTLYETPSSVGDSAAGGALDLRCSSSSLQQPTADLSNISADTGNGVLNLSTKSSSSKTNQAPSVSPQPLSTLNRLNPRKPQQALKRQISPALSSSAVSPASTASKMPRLEPQPNVYAAAVDSSSDQVYERRYGCPICSFEASDKGVVREHVATSHPAATSTSTRNRQSGSAKRNGSASSAMLPIRCLSVSKTPMSAIPVAASPLVIQCDSEIKSPKSKLTKQMSATPQRMEIHCTSPVDMASSAQSLNKCSGFQCNVCHYRTYAKANYEKHVAYHEDLKIFKCSACGYRCNWKWDMNKHCRALHNIQTDQQSDNNPGSQQQTPAHIVVLSLEEARSTLADYLLRSSSTVSSAMTNLVSSSATLSHLKLFRCSKCPFASRRRKMVERHQRQSHASLINCSVLEVAADPRGHEAISPDVGGLPTPSTSSSTGSHSSPPLNAIVNSSANLVPASTARIFKCSICGLRSLWKKSIRNHISSQHTGSADARISVVYISQRSQRLTSFSPSTVKTVTDVTESALSPNSSPASRRGAKSDSRRFKCPAATTRHEAPSSDKDDGGSPLLSIDETEGNSRVDSVVLSDPLKTYYCHRSQHVFNCRKCSYHTSRRALFLSHCASHFTSYSGSSSLGFEVCNQCGFASSSSSQAERHELLWHVRPASPSSNHIVEAQAVTKDDVDMLSVGFRCTVCNESMPKADAAAMRSHVTSLHVPPALLALGAVRLDALFVPLAQ